LKPFKKLLEVEDIDEIQEGDSLVVEGVRNETERARTASILTHGKEEDKEHKNTNVLAKSGI
jgi:hypothetical protein